MLYYVRSSYYARQCISMHLSMKYCHLYYIGAVMFTSCCPLSIRCVCLWTCGECAGRCNTWKSQLKTYSEKIYPWKTKSCYSSSDANKCQYAGYSLGWPKITWRGDAVTLTTDHHTSATWLQGHHGVNHTDNQFRLTEDKGRHVRLCASMSLFRTSDESESCVWACTMAVDVSCGRFSSGRLLLVAWGKASSSSWSIYCGTSLQKQTGIHTRI